MPSTKTRTSIFDSVTLTAAAGDTVSAAVDLADGYGAALNLKITNGGTGPTLPAEIQIEVSNDDSEWFEFGGPLVSQTGNAVVTSWGGVDIPIGTKHLRLAAGSNTGQDVVIDADISEVTAV